MSTYSHDPNACWAVADAMDAYSKNIVDQLEAQAAAIQSSLADWRDDAKTEYETRRREWENLAQQLPGKLTLARQSLGQILDAYAHTTKQGVNGWGNYSAR
ncbi:MAG: WXG100 family type VII secretion target [Janthinobacterium lividum]